MTSDKEVHLVPVFRKDLPYVWKLLAELNSAEEAQTAGHSAVLFDTGTWSKEDLNALHGMCKPVQRAILTRIAESDATYGDLKAAGAQASKSKTFTFHNTRAALAWISKYGKKVKGADKGAWPITFTYQGSDQPEGLRYKYSMDKPAARMWLEIAQTP